MTWQDILVVIASMPNLKELEIGYNCLTDVSFDCGRHFGPKASVRTINLNSNQICGWANICLTLSDFPWYTLYLLYGLDVTNCVSFCSLERVILANNQINNIPFPTAQRGWPQLKQLSLSFNHLQLWSDISALAAWAPSLESLTLLGNPVMTGEIKA